MAPTAAVDKACRQRLAAADGIGASGVARPGGALPMNDADPRALTYTDPDAVTETDDAVPVADTAVDADDGQPTAAEAARFLLDLYDRTGGRLYLGVAVERFREEY
jgi:hypothetical protein